MSNGHTAEVSGWVGHCFILRRKEWYEPFNPIYTSGHVCSQSLPSLQLLWKYNSHSSTHDTHPSRRSRRALAIELHERDNVGLVVAHMLSPPRDSLCTHTHMHTH